MPTVAVFLTLVFCVAFACMLRDRLIIPGVVVFVLTYFLLVGAAIGEELSELEAKGITGVIVAGFVFVVWVRVRRRSGPP